MSKQLVVSDVQFARLGGTPENRSCETDKDTAALAGLEREPAMLDHRENTIAEIRPDPQRISLVRLIAAIPDITRRLLLPARPTLTTQDAATVARGRRPTN